MRALVTRRWSRGSATAEYAVGVLFAVGFAAILIAPGFLDFLEDLLAQLWRLLLDPRRFVLPGLPAGRAPW